MVLFTVGIGGVSHYSGEPLLKLPKSGPECFNSGPVSYCACKEHNCTRQIWLALLRVNSFCLLTYLIFLETRHYPPGDIVLLCSLLYGIGFHGLKAC